MKKMANKEKINAIKENSAQIIIGKNGLTENLITTIRKRLNKDKIIKIKMLKTAIDSEEMGRKKFAELIAKELNANLIEIRGYNLIIQKK